MAYYLQKFKMERLMDQLYNLEAWRALTTIHDTGSLSAAANALDSEVSTVSRLVAGLEKALGRELINRRHRPIEITDEGKAAAASIRPVLKAHSAIVSRLLNASSQMEGTINIATAGGVITTGRLTRMLMEFQKLFPNVDFNVSRGRPVSECRDGKIDIASISGDCDEQGLVKIPRGRSVFIPVATPEYLKKNGVPLTPEDLIHHTGFVYTGPVRSLTTELTKNGQVRELRWKNRMQSTDILMIKEAVMQGLGVAVDMPLIHCYEELERGELVTILDGWHRPPIPAYAVCSTSAWHIRRVRVFMQWYCDQFLTYFQMTEDAAHRVLKDAFEQYLS